MTRPSQKVVVAAAFVAAMFLDILDATIVNVALPSMATAFGAEATSAEWVVLGYLLSLAVFIPASGWIGDRVGTKRTFLVAVGLFTAASVLCGLAASLDQLIAFRLLQGMGGGMLTPVGTAMLFRAFPPSERAAAGRVIIVPTVTAPALGPVIGGALLESLSWRWIFLVNVPVGVTVVVAGALLLEEHRVPSAGRFDLAGFVLSCAGLALLLYALSRGAEAGWASPVILATGPGWRGRGRRAGGRRAADARADAAPAPVATGCSGRPTSPASSGSAPSWRCCSAPRCSCSRARGCPPSMPGWPRSPRPSACCAARRSPPASTSGRS